MFFENRGEERLKKVGAKVARYGLSSLGGLQNRPNLIIGASVQFCCAKDFEQSEQFREHHILGQLATKMKNNRLLRYNLRTIS